MRASSACDIFSSQSFLESLLDEAHSYGSCTLFLEERNEQAITYQDGTCRPDCTLKQGCGIQLDSGREQTYSAVAGLTPQAILRCLQTAKGKTREKQYTAFRGLQALQHYGPQLSADGPVTLAAMDEMIHQVLADHPLGAAKQFAISVLYNEKAQHVALATSQGRWAIEQRLWGSFSVEVQETGGTGRLWIERSAGWSKSLPMSAYREKLVALLCSSEKAISQASAAQEAPNGCFPVIFAPGTGGVFIHEMCGHLLEGSFVAQGHSPFAEKISTRIASELLNVYDDPSLAEGFGSHLIDDEGQATGPVHLIRNGVLTTFLTNDVTGRLLGLPSTASARREDFRYPATPRMSNTYIPAGDAACDASTMIAELPQGLFAQRLGRGQVNHQTGQFALEVREGMWIDRGRPVYAIKPLWIVGQASQTLMHIQAIGHDFALAPVMCKSVSGSLPVGVGIPSLLVNQLYLTASTDFHL